MSKGDDKNIYQEDISVHRVDFEDVDVKQQPEQTNPSEVVLTGSVEPQTDVTDKLDSRLSEIAEDNKRKLVSGYTIQVYTGSSREAANNAKIWSIELPPMRVLKFSMYSRITR